MKQITRWAILWIAITGSLPAVEADEPAHEAADIVVVVGAPGEPEFGAQFAAWSSIWKQVARDSGSTLHPIGFPSQPNSAEPSSSEPVRDQLQSRLEELKSKSTTPLWIVLIGHGTFDGSTAKFNVEGRDFSAAELNQWLDGCQRTLVIANCSSSSAPFIERLSGPGRIVMTATRSGYELNFSRFGKFFSEALVGTVADLDKDEQTSVLEAFLYASREVERYYREAGQLATEHALLDDNADRKGSQSTHFAGLEPKDPKKTEIDGQQAHSVHLVPSARERSLTSDQRARRDALEASIRQLKRAKPGLEEEAYYDQLEQLLLELARVYAEADSKPSERIQDREG